MKNSTDHPLNKHTEETVMANKAQKDQKTNEKLKIEKDPDYILRMSHAPARGTASPIYQMLPLLLFAAATIMIVRLHIYTRPMSQFYWTPQTDTTQLYDFFSYDKMVFLVVMTVIAVFLMIVSFASQSMTIKRTPVYIPMAIYSLFVIISYICSDYKEFSLWGYNDRFEGTIPLLCYMLMLFFAINTINSEKNVKQLIWAIAIMAVLLSLLGITQAIGKDFFRTVIGQKLISPNLKLADGTTLHQAIENSFANGEQFYNFEFQNKEVYQTVYNINYVSFYTTMLIPLFAMLFFRSLDKDLNESLWKKVGLGIICALLLFNLIYSKSSGGYIGVGIAAVLALIILNKYIRKYWKPLIILLVIIGIILIASIDRWMPELSSALKSIYQPNRVVRVAARGDVEPAKIRPWIDYIKTGDSLEFSINGEPLSLYFDSAEYGITLDIRDNNDDVVKLVQSEDGFYLIDDDRFYNYAKIILWVTDNQDACLMIRTNDIDWTFINKNQTIFYVNDYGNLVSLNEIEHSVFNNHLAFGSKRGYIWATSIPLLKHTLFKGYGADTYALSFPQNDYAWKLNVDYSLNMIIDKPHNMYLQTGINTGCLSLIAILALYVIYFVQSISLGFYLDNKYDYCSYIRIGLFCGLAGFLFSGIVNDSSVSVMPLFYSLLGMGFSINMFALYKNDKLTEKST